MELNGKVALVTGGSRGIGAAIAARLARQGAAVAITYASGADAARSVVKQIEADGGRAVAVQADFGDPAAAGLAVQRTVREFGRIDVLVNNAGVFSVGPLDEVSLGDVDRVLAVHVRACFLAAQAAARQMPDGGRIVNIGSCLADRVPGPGMTLYATSKAALAGLTKGLARDLGPRGITVTLVHPGPTDTDMNPADGPSADWQRSFTALGRYATADEVAATVGHLAGEGGRYVTGATIAVDGGFAA